MSGDNGLVILDVDGVLRDSSILIHEGTKRAFATVQLPCPFAVEDLWHLKGYKHYNEAPKTMEALVATLEYSKDQKALVATLNYNMDPEARAVFDEYIKHPGHILQMAMKTDLLDKLVANKLTDRHQELIGHMVAVYRDLFNSNEGAAFVKPFDYCKDAIKILRQSSYDVAVLSNSGRKSVDRDLEHFGKENFAYVATADEVKQKKPSGEGIKHIMRKLGREPSSTYHIGDTVNDIRAARDAKCNAIAVLSGMGTKKQLVEAKPDAIHSNLLDASKALTTKFKSKLTIS